MQHIRQADAVLVPSHHPMFLGNLRHDANAMLFPQQDAIAFATQIEQLLTNPARYERLSHASLDTWRKLQELARFEDFVSRWLRNGSAERRWIAEHRLVALHRTASGTLVPAN